MYGLLYKELILNKKQLLEMTAALILFSAVLFISPDNDTQFSAEIFLMISLCIMVCMYLVVGMMQQGIFEADEIKRWQYYITASPQMAEGHIRAKYVFVFLISIIFATYCIYLNPLSAAVHDLDYALPDVILLDLTCLQLLIRAIEMPFIVRFGSKYGNYFRMVIGFTTVFAVIVYGLFGDISMFGTLEEFITRIAELIQEDKFSQGLTIFLRLKTLIVFVIYYLSYKLSCRLYLKGGEYYDK